MARRNVVRPVSAIVCLVSTSCEGLLGGVEVVASRPDLPASAVTAGGAGGMDPRGPSVPPVIPTPIDVRPEGSAPAGALQPPASDPAASSDAGRLDVAPDASPAPSVPSAIVVDGPAAELPLIGVDGGDPRLGVCEGGVVIGVRTTANPSEEIFGQRLTFVEPICGSVLQEAPDAVGAGAGSIRVTRDDAMVAWAETDGFLGVPTTEVPDPRLLWVLQPATLCPETAPVLVGLSGEYDPVAPDVTDTVAIRSLVIECAPLVLAPNGVDVVAAEAGHQLIANADSFATGGDASYRSACEGGAVTTQILVHAGFWLDGFVLGCSTLRAD